MDYPADSTVKLCQGGKGRYIGREGFIMDNSSGGKCEPVIVFRESGSVCMPNSVCVLMLWCFKQGNLMQG